MSQSSTYHVSGLLEKMAATDKDFRFMATNDLIAELQGDSLRLDIDSERKVTKTVLKLLEDQNGEVQNLAVKCLGPLVRKIKEPNIVTVIKELTNGMIRNNKENIRGICGIGLKTIVSETPVNSYVVVEVILKEATDLLIDMARTHTDVSVRLEALEILAEMLNKFGTAMGSFHTKILHCCTEQLEHSRLSVRKRAITALGHLVCCSGPEQFDTLIKYLVHHLDQPQTPLKQDDIKTLIQCLTVLTRHPSRTSEHVPQIQRLLMQYAEREDDEVRDFVLQGIETLFRRCPRQMLHYLQPVIQLLLRFLQHDPNYQYGEDDDEDMADPDQEMEEDGDGDDDYSDDDDISWKVRRSAAKCLDTCIQTYPELAAQFYETVVPVLTKRFLEREETVKLEVFNALHSLLKQTRLLMSRSGDVTQQFNDPASAGGHLKALLPNLIGGLRRQSRARSPQVRHALFTLLKETVLTVPNGGLSSFVDTLIQMVSRAVADKSSNNNMKVDALNFLVFLVSNNPIECFRHHIEQLVEMARNTVSDTFYRIALEGLDLIQCLSALIKPLGFGHLSLALYTPTVRQLQAVDRDLELTEKVISTAAVITYHLGDQLRNEMPSCLQVIAKRLHNEITRQQAVKALTTIAESPLKIDMGGVITSAIGELAGFLRKNDRNLRLATLRCLEAFWQHQGHYINDTCLALVIKEIPPLVTDHDLLIAQLSVHLVELFLLRHGASVAGVVAGSLLDPITRLAQSFVVHGMALEALLSLMATVSRLRLEQFSHQMLLNRLLSPIRSSTTQGLGLGDLIETMSTAHPAGGPASSGPLAVHRDAYPNMARCVAELVRHLPQAELQAMIDALVLDVRLDNPNSAIQYISLLTLGELGKTIDLSQREDMLNLLMGTLAYHAEEMKIGAAFSLGKMTLGRPDKFMPYIMAQIERMPKQQYFLLHSLREIIASLSSSSAQTAQQVLGPYRDTIWELLVKNSGCDEEGTRNLVAECLGKLTLMEPGVLVPRLRDHIVSRSPQSPLARFTLITAVKYTLTPHASSTLDPLIRTALPDFLASLSDPDLGVRRATLVTLTTAAHNKPALIRDLLPHLQPQVYAETVVRPELIREVEMGPFKHQEDDGLDLRKCAFECISTILERCFDQIDVGAFLGAIEDGLKDHADIKLSTYLMLGRLTGLCPGELINRMERIVSPIKTVLTSKPKQDWVKQEQEKLEELKRAALKVVYAFSLHEDINRNRFFSDLSKTIEANVDIKKMYSSLAEEMSKQQQ